MTLARGQGAVCDFDGRPAVPVDAAFVVNTFEDESDSVHVYYESD